MSTINMIYILSHFFSATITFTRSRLLDPSRYVLLKLTTIKVTSAGTVDLENSNLSAVSFIFSYCMLTHLSLLQGALANCWCMWWPKMDSKIEDAVQLVHFTNLCYFIYTLNPLALALIKILFLSTISIQNQPCRSWEWHKWSLNQILSLTTDQTGQFLFWSLSMQKLILINKERSEEITNYFTCFSVLKNVR